MNCSDGHVRDLRRRISLDDLVAHRVHQVGLSEAGVAVDEQRVVELRRAVGRAPAGGGGELAVVADDEPLERVASVQPGGARRLLRRSGGGARGHGRGRRRRRHGPHGRPGAGTRGGVSAVSARHPFASERRKLHPLGASLAPVLEPQGEGVAELSLGELAEERAVLVLDPLDGETRRRRDDERLLVERDGLGGSEPGPDSLLREDLARGGGDRGPGLRSGQFHAVSRSSSTGSGRERGTDLRGSFPQSQRGRPRRPATGRRAAPGAPRTAAAKFDRIRPPV